VAHRIFSTHENRSFVHKKFYFHIDVLVKYDDNRMEIRWHSLLWGFIHILAHKVENNVQKFQKFGRFFTFTNVLWRKVTNFWVWYFWKIDTRSDTLRSLLKSTKIFIFWRFICVWMWKIKFLNKFENIMH